MTVPHRWRPMRAEDIAAVAAISDQVHDRFSERPAIYAGRLALYPAGCFVLEGEGALSGYLISHPWKTDSPPELDMPVGAIPADADGFYIHDLALMPQARGSGAAAVATQLAVDAAQDAGFDNLFLMAIRGADRFWRKQGFVDIEGERAGAKRASYGVDSRFMRRSLRAE